jgi:uncharacterized membrane protein YeaQ/YmgE (transglycosylase-associated protein family)
MCSGFGLVGNIVLGVVGAIVAATRAASSSGAT